MGLIAACSPLFVIAWAGLRFSGVRPLLVVRQDPWNAGSVPLLEFNTRSSPFGYHLRRLSVDQLPALLWVVAGKCRLKDLPLAWKRY